MIDAGTVRVGRQLRDAAEPIAACVYFAPEALGAYEEFGLSYPSGYFCSRGACLGRAPGEVISAAFGVFNPAIVTRFVDAGWSATDPETLLAARERGAMEALRRMLGSPDAGPVVTVLREVMEERPLAGRTLFAGLRSLDFPDDPLAALWRVCDYVREHRGDGHIAVWTSAGCDAVEICLLTELYWGIEVGSYISSRGWGPHDVEAGLARLEARGLVRDRAFTDEGREFRRSLERATDTAEAGVVAAVGDRMDDVLVALRPLAERVVEQGGYPVQQRTATTD